MALTVLFNLIILFAATYSYCYNYPKQFCGIMSEAGLRSLCGDRQYFLLCPLPPIAIVKLCFCHPGQASPNNYLLTKLICKI